MNRQENMGSAPTPVGARRMLWSDFDSRDSRTVRGRLAAGLVPSAVVVLSMSVVTVVTLVLIVTTLAKIHSYNEAWSRRSATPEIWFGDNGTVPAGYIALVEEQTGEFAFGETHSDAIVTPDR